MSKLLVLLTVLSALVAVTLGYSAGAPETVCDDMTPKHPATPKTTKFPYKIVVSQKEAKAGELLDIKITGKTFKGFLLEVRQGNKAVGSFQIPDTHKYAKTINCHGNTASAATHKNAENKHDLVLQWKAPAAKGEYQIYATVAEAGDVYWVRQPIAQKIKIQ